MRILAIFSASLALTLALAATSYAATGTQTISYGPYTIPAGNGDPHAHHSDGAGMIVNQLSLNVARPCSGQACTLTGLKANMVYTDGTTANWNNESMLHHMILMRSGTGRSDLTCPGGYGGVSGSGALQRIFASGNERTPVDFTGTPYGVKLASNDQLHLVADLMNIKTSPQTVYVTVEYKWATGADDTSKKDAAPIWLDVDGCGDSEFDAPFGFSDTQNNISSPVTGGLIGAAGHLHDHGANLQVENTTRGTNMCTSLPGFGETPGYLDTSKDAAGNPAPRKRISSMTSCYGSATAPAAWLTQGDNIRMHTRYYAGAEHGHATHGAMGIMIGYVDRTLTPPAASSSPGLSISAPADNNLSSNNNPNVTFSATNATSVTCKLNRLAPVACVSPVNVAALNGTATLPDGAYTVEVKASNAAGAWRTKTVSFAIDTKAPAISIPEPAEGQVFTTADVDVHLLISDANTVTATCSLDGAPATVCTPEDGHSHTTLTGLANGTHTYTVNAVDTLGFSSSLVRTFSVNAGTPPAAPTVSITSPADNAYLNSTSATVAFTTTNSPTSTTCKLDSGAAAACSGSVSYTGLAQGAHTVTVTATNAGGSATDTVPFRVDTVLPTVTITSPTNNQRVRSRTVNVNFSVTDASPTTTTCKLNSGAASACTSPKTYTNLANGSYTVTIVATDAAGNARTATRSFTVRP